MTSSPIDHPKGTSVRAWSGRRRRVIIVVTAGLLALGAFLLWGPVGLGNGPLSVAFYGTQDSVHSGRGPVGFVIPIHNSGDSYAV